MESLKELYRIGVGPSSSHTMGPDKAARQFLDKHPDAAGFRVTLFGSLAATGKGHFTDVAIEKALGERCREIIWRPEEFKLRHPNALTFEALDTGGDIISTWTAYSIGGGAILDDDQAEATELIYPLTNMADILNHCCTAGKTFWEFVADVEGDGLWGFLGDVWLAMTGAIDRGLKTQGVLPGGLGLPRKAWSFGQKSKITLPHFRQTGQIASFALAVSEENASGGQVVTAPTCGACGIVPAVLYYLMPWLELSEKDIYQALATSGLIGNIIKHNGSISGAEVGCQGEVGSACAMAAGAAAQLMGGTIRQIEYAAEMGLEHHLGLTCDPVKGLVQIPCIERNAVAATRALTCAEMALMSDGTHRIPFDDVVQVMTETGKDLPNLYRETASGGLARLYRFKTHPKG